MKITTQEYQAEQVRRLAAKTQDQRMVNEVVSGPGMSPWEAQVVVDVIREVYFATPGGAPLRDLRVVFDQLFGVGATPGERRERRAEDKSILDWLGDAVARLNKDLGAADRARLADYLDGDSQTSMCAELRRHMEGCNNCRVVVNTAARTVQLFRGEEPIDYLVFRGIELPNRASPFPHHLPCSLP